MGQAHSDHAATAATPEQLSSRLAHRLAEKCFTPLELTHFKDNFVNLADEQDHLQYWKEDTLCRFLQIPDVLAVNHVLGQMLGYLGAWPFSSLAPAILTREALCKIVAILTRRYERVLKGGRRDRAKLIFRSMAVHDRRQSEPEKPEPELKHGGNLEASMRLAQSDHQTKAHGYAIDAPGNDEEDEDDDELALAALESLDAIEVFSLEKEKLESTEGNLRQAQIPFDNFRSLVLLMLLAAPLQPQENLSSLAQRATDDSFDDLQRIADSILWSFDPETHTGITNSSFKTITNHSLPYLFEGFNALFEHFLFSKHLDLSKRKRTSSSASHLSLPSASPTDDTDSTPTPILAHQGDILTSALLCQISFFIPSPTLFHRLRLLYSGSNDGFSINSFEQKVLNWRAPTILLISGTRDLAQKRTADDKIQPTRFPHGAAGNSKDNRLVFGVYLNVPWKHTHKEPIGDDQSLLFQLEPVHDVYRASSLNHDYTTLTKSGIGFGSPLPRAKPVSGLSTTLSFGPVSLNLDENLEYAVFVHDAAGGGAFGTSRAKRGNFEERFEVEQLEVWGCGGDDVAKEQRKRWQWEEREAAARRGVNMGKDKEATYQLLEMAGLVGQNRSGGSMA